MHSKNIIYTFVSTKRNIMKTLFKITDAKIIITVIVLSFVTFFTLMLNDTKTNQQPKKFTGIDAAGFIHYPNGDTERMEVKFK